MRTHASAYEHLLLGEYAASLDSIPLDVAKSLADLRELDGVLNNAIVSFTARLNALTDVLEDHEATAEMRFLKLMDLADHATQLKMGNEDKIRVATTTADILQTHRNYLNEILQKVAVEDAAFDPLRNSSKTTFPTLVFRPFPNPSPIETGRRRRVQVANRGLVDANPTPAKRQKRTTTMPNTGQPATRAEEETRLPSRWAPSTRTCATGFQMAPARPTAVAHGRDPHQARRAMSAGQRRAGAGYSKPCSTRNMRRHAPAGRPRSLRIPMDVDERAPGVSGTNGANSYNNTPAGTAPPAGGDDDGDQDGELDEKQYCYCNQISYGDMVACDNEECPREWFHLGCIGITSAPKGSWYCDDCLSKRDAKRNRARTTKRRAAGGATRGKRPTAGTPS
ncbi:hypothetical protein BKA62DRAFT_685327 [Auriculariales sp. MPI-PUGE-AT-0066]|nr:hypothetical protein BKA62DRAFT_685327 [Auriculariales sp. MPI-PUGE-AT-0066]